MRRTHRQKQIEAVVAADPVGSYCTSSLAQYIHCNRKHKYSRRQDGEGHSHKAAASACSSTSSSALINTLAVVASVAIVSTDSEEIQSTAAAAGEVQVALRPPAPSTPQRLVRLIVGFIKFGLTVAYFTLLLPIAFLVDKVFGSGLRASARALLRATTDIIDGTFSGLTGTMAASQFYDERFVIDFVNRGAEAFVESMIANYAIQKLYKHPFVAEKYGKLEFSSAKGDVFGRPVLGDVDLVPMVPRTYEFSLHGSKSKVPLRVVAQVALGPPHGGSATDSARAGLAVHTVYLAIEDPESKERVVVVDPKNFHAQRLATSLLRLVDDSSRLALVEGSSLTSVVLSEQKLTKKSFSKLREFSFKFCGSRGCAEIRSSTKDPATTGSPDLVTSGSTMIEISNKDGHSSRHTFTEDQIAAANTVSFIELLSSVRERLGGPLTIEAASIKHGLDIEIDKVINTLDMTLKGPAGESAPVHLVFLVDPLLPSHKILWRVCWGDSSSVIYENTVSALQKLAAAPDQ